MWNATSIPDRGEFLLSILSNTVLDLAIAFYVDEHRPWDESSLKIALCFKSCAQCVMYEIAYQVTRAHNYAWLGCSFFWRNDLCFVSNSAVYNLRKRRFVHLSAQTFPVLQAKSPKSVLAAALCDATLLLFRSLG